MKKNVGKIDKTVRILVGLGVVSAGIAFESYWGALGLIPIATGLIGWCPPYALFGISTCSTEKKADV